MEIQEAFAIVNEACSLINANRATHQRIIDAINTLHAVLKIDPNPESEATVDSVIASVPELPPD